MSSLAVTVSLSVDSGSLAHWTPRWNEFIEGEKNNTRDTQSPTHTGSPPPTRPSSRGSRAPRALLRSSSSRRRSNLPTPRSSRSSGRRLRTKWARRACCARSPRATCHIRVSLSLSLSLSLSRPRWRGSRFARSLGEVLPSTRICFETLYEKALFFFFFSEMLSFFI